jgi:hypothetical protein
MCECDCGKEKEILGKDLKNGNTKSCGCLRREEMSKRRTIHGESDIRLHIIWTGMRQRCERPTQEKHKKDYRDRGIAVCAEWHTYTNFRNWALANGYTENLTIDRIDNNKGYYPENCRWTDNKTQANNRRTNHNITFNGDTHTISQWAEIIGIKYNTLHRRLTISGWSVEKAFTSDVERRNLCRV